MRFHFFGLVALAAAGCGTLALSITPEGNIAIGPPGAATAAPGMGAPISDQDHAPPPHASRTAFDAWRPPPLGVLPPGGVLRNTSNPVDITAGGLDVVFRASDRLVPTWGGDVYVRVDLRAGALVERPPPRDLVVVLDTRDAQALPAARRMAAALFETLRAGDRGALLASAGWGGVVVPLLSYGAAPLLIDRAHTFVAHGGDDMAAAIGRAVPLLSSSEDGRLRRMVVFWSSGDEVDAETREWVQAATHAGIDATLVPLTHAAGQRLQPLSLSTDATVLPEVHDADREEGAALEELAALPPMQTVARDVTIAVDSEPGPLTVVEVAGATADWTPVGADVPLGDVHTGDVRTIVLRGLVPPWRAGTDYSLVVTLRYTNDAGAHEVRRALPARYSSSPREYAGSRAGDVIQYVSLLNTLSNVQAAIARRDAGFLLALHDAAALQARSLVLYAREHNDAVMNEQAGMLLQLLSDVPTLVHSPVAAPVAGAHGEQQP